MFDCAIIVENGACNLQLIVLVSVEWLKYQTQIDSQISKPTQKDKFQRGDTAIRHDQGI